MTYSCNRRRQGRAGRRSNLGSGSRTASSERGHREKTDVARVVPTAPLTSVALTALQQLANHKARADAGPRDRARRNALARVVEGGVSNQRVLHGLVVPSALRGASAGKRARRRSLQTGAAVTFAPVSS